MRLLSDTIVLGLMLAGFAAQAAPDVPGNKSTNAALPTGSAGIAGDLHGAGDSDWYRVQLTRAYAYGVLVIANCSETTVRLLDGKGQTLSSVRGSYEFPAFISHYTNYSGLYYVEIKSLGIYSDCDPRRGGVYSGSFRLSAVRECGEDRRTRCILPIGASVDSQISSYNDKDWFKVEVPRKGIYTFSVTPQPHGDFYIPPRMAVRRADTSVITDTVRHDAYQCSPYGGAGACLRVPLKPGTYYVVVRIPDEGGGLYRLSARAGK